MKPAIILSSETSSEAETISFGAEFSRELKCGDVVACYGDLGSGKTAFIRGVCRGLRIREHVASPTFTFVNEYHAEAFPVYHFDFYRLGDVRELREIGVEDYLSRADGVCLIEWAEKIQTVVSSVPRYAVELSVCDGHDKRRLVIRKYQTAS